MYRHNFSLGLCERSLIAINASTRFLSTEILCLLWNLLLSDDFRLLAMAEKFYRFLAYEFFHIFVGEKGTQEPAGNCSNFAKAKIPPCYCFGHKSKQQYMSYYEASYLSQLKPIQLFFQISILPGVQSSHWN